MFYWQSSISYSPLVPVSSSHLPDSQTHQQMHPPPALWASVSYCVRVCEGVRVWGGVFLLCAVTNYSNVVEWGCCFLIWGWGCVRVRVSVWEWGCCFLTFQWRTLSEVLALSVCTWPVASPCLWEELSAQVECISREGEIWVWWRCGEGVGKVWERCGVCVGKVWGVCVCVKAICV